MCFHYVSHNSNVNVVFDKINGKNNVTFIVFSSIGIYDTYSLILSMLWLMCVKMVTIATLTGIKLPVR